VQPEKILNVCFGSLADITTRPRHVRFNSNNGRWAARFMNTSPSLTVILFRSGLAALALAVVKECDQFGVTPVSNSPLLIHLLKYHHSRPAPASIQYRASGRYPSSGRRSIILHDGNEGFNGLTRMRARKFDKGLDNLRPTAWIPRLPFLKGLPITLLLMVLFPVLLAAGVEKEGAQTLTRLRLRAWF
jgi:hypothetical protein